MTKQDIYICSALRTPIGSFQGGFAQTSAVVLGATVIREILQRTPQAASKTGECVMGCVLQGGLGQAPARQAWLGGGGDESVPCTTINRVCGSGMQAIISVARAMLNNEYSVAVAGGMENMTLAPFALPRARQGYQLGVPNAGMIDLLIHDGLWDPYENQHMGTICEQLLHARGLTRERQDDFAISSYERAIKAQRDGLFSHEMVTVAAKGKKGNTTLAADEGPLRFHPDKFRRLRPAFDKKTGTITAGNASAINDGAAALLLANADGCDQLGLNPLARIVDWSAVAAAPTQFPLSPTLAIQALLAKTGMAITDVDCMEINEAFSAVPLLAMDALSVDGAIVNPLGGAVALGHPIGASGARIVATLLSSLKHLGGKRGLATLCIGGGEGVALMVELV